MIELTVNGAQHRVDVPEDTPVPWVLSEDLGRTRIGGQGMNRRQFLNAAGMTAASLLLAPTGGRAQSRKEVFIGGRRARVVDIHAHCDFLAVRPVIEGTSMAGANLNRLLGAEYLGEMDARGIDVAALSVNRFWWYEADRDQAREIVAIHERELAVWCERYPDRFVAMSSPSLQYPDLAVEQVRHAVSELGHRGVAVGGNIGGKVPSTAEYDEFWGTVEELDVPVFMHPTNSANIVQPGVLGGPGGLNNVIGNPLETTLFLSRMIFDGTLDRFPNLKICAAHGGGYLPSYIGRTEVACARNNANCVNTRSPSEYLRTQIFADSMVFNEEGLRHLVAVMGAGQVVYGTDIPAAWPDTLDLIVESPSLSDAEKEAIVGGNLIEMLKL